jgi:delta-aminolevulinic acid dehydratase/porphobilinogen synthase
MYGSVTEQRARRIRTDQELRELLRNPDLATDIKIMRIYTYNGVTHQNESKKSSQENV